MPIFDSKFSVSATNTLELHNKITICLQEKPEIASTVKRFASEAIDSFMINPLFSIKDNWMYYLYFSYSSDKDILCTMATEDLKSGRGHMLGYSFNKEANLFFRSPNDFLLD